MNRIVLVIMSAVLLFSGCATTDPLDDPHATVEQMYTQAKQELTDGRYERAIKGYEALQARYPYGHYAQQAALEAAYAYYKNEEKEQALAALDRFIKQYPTHPNIDYAYYLIGIINFIEDKSLFKDIAQQDIAERDPQAAKASFEAFQTLLKRFPKSRYAKDARERMLFLTAALAEHELHIARYYYQRGAYLAAANRAKTVLEYYANTSRVKSALAMLILSYDKIGESKLRDDAKRVFERNYPGVDPLQAANFNAKAWWHLW